jgi:D-lactate dehydrogenase (cytochrome)
VPASIVRVRRPTGRADPIRPVRDADVLRSYLEDAAHFTGGHAAGLYAPANEAQVAAVLQSSAAVLPIGAQSSLTGGATPMGETLLATSRLDRIVAIGTDWVRVEAGVTIAELDAALKSRGRCYPPAPTFTGACVGGTIATNAAGAATFKYGTTRDWIAAITVVLPGGDVLDIERGVTRAGQGAFDLELATGRARVIVPGYRMPEVPKLSAGYYARPDMDLIDLFIGSEGTLGVVTAATLRVLPRRPETCLVFVTVKDRRTALTLVDDLREAARATWRSRDPRGIDVSAIEHMDERCLTLLREDGIDRQYGVSIPSDASIALLIALELPPGTRAEEAFDQIAAAADPVAPDTPLVRFSRMLAAAGVIDAAQIALPTEVHRSAQLIALREAVPAAVNKRVGLAKQSIDGRIEKTAADMIVPFEHIDTLLEIYREGFARRGLDAAVWGHISDGNVHPNVIPRSFGDVVAGRQAILEFGRRVIGLGGAPLAEHGVGRSAVKQSLLRAMYGDEGIAAMQKTKRALDPQWKLAPGVLFDRGGG